MKLKVWSLVTAISFAAFAMQLAAFAQPVFASGTAANAAGSATEFPGGARTAIFNTWVPIKNSSVQSPVTSDFVAYAPNNYSINLGNNFAVRTGKLNLGFANSCAMLSSNASFSIVQIQMTDALQYSQSPILNVFSLNPNLSASCATLSVGSAVVAAGGTGANGTIGADYGSASAFGFAGDSNVSDVFDTSAKMHFAVAAQQNLAVVNVADPRVITLVTADSAPASLSEQISAAQDFALPDMAAFAGRVQAFVGSISSGIEYEVYLNRVVGKSFSTASGQFKILRC